MKYNDLKKIYEFRNQKDTSENTERFVSKEYQEKINKINTLYGDELDLLVSNFNKLSEFFRIAFNSGAREAKTKDVKCEFVNETFQYKEHIFNPFDKNVIEKFPKALKASEMYGDSFKDRIEEILECIKDLKELNNFLKNLETIDMEYDKSFIEFQKRRKEDFIKAQETLKKLELDNKDFFNKLNI